jgi:hypothetical protein
MLIRILFGCLVCIGRAEAQDLKATLGQVEKSVAAGDFATALKELEWANSDITQRHNNHLKTFLPDKLGDYQSVEPQKDGLPNFAAAGAGASREYAKANSKLTITVGIQSDIGLQAKFGRLCDPDIARAMNNTEIFRVNAHAATYQERDVMKYKSLTVCLDGGVVRFASSNESIKDDLKKTAEHFDYQKLEAYLRGLN